MGDPESQQVQGRVHTIESDAGHAAAGPRPSDHFRVLNQAGVARPLGSASLVNSRVCWEVLAQNQEHRTVLCLRGLPREMCNSNVLQGLIDGAGLDAQVRSIRINSSTLKRFGVGIVKASSPSEVAKVARFFHGRTFSRGRRFCGSLPISVSFAAHQAEPQRVVYTLAGVQLLGGDRAREFDADGGSTDVSASFTRSSSPMSEREHGA
mmetsp:Transcript_97846/g.276801  ORF Transcript_97846/g.276801 Transcript_97846/m.276801 type:complete len:208 (+) Transcript_97846:147-770(+)